MKKDLIEAQYRKFDSDNPHDRGICALCKYHVLKKGLLRHKYYYCGKLDFKTDFGNTCKYYSCEVDLSCFINK